MTNDLRVVEERLRIVEILLAGMLLKEEPRPDVERLAKLIEIRKATLSELFPQRDGEKKRSPGPAKVGVR